MPNDVVTRAIDAVCAGDHLTADHASAVLAEIMEGRADQVQTGAFLIALRAKGETVPELVGLARTMRSLAAPVAHGARRPGRHRRHRRRPFDLQRLDHGGPGRRRRRAARSPSTATAPTPAGAAPPTCSRRSASTSSSTPRQVGRCIDEVGFGFMFAPRHHAAMAHVIPVRKELGRADDLQLPRPADQPGRGAERQLLGVSDRHYQETIAEALVGLGSVRAMVVAAEDGVDELSISARTRVIEVVDGRTAEWFVEPGRIRPAPKPSWRTSPAARRRRTPPPRAPCSRARRGRAATWSCSTPAPRSTSAASPPTSPRASRRPPRRSIPGAARDLLERLIATTAALAV